MWKPHSAAPRPPCEACGSKSYHRPFSNAEGYVVCTLDCYYAMRWKKRFNHLAPTTAQGKYYGRRDD